MSPFVAVVRLFSFLARRWLRCLVAGSFILAVIVAGTNAWVIARSRSRVISDLRHLPTVEVGLVLGTSPTLRGGYRNPFFEGRMNTAARLYQSGKVRHLLLSGDNGSRDYDEPSAMRVALIARGVPASAITLDDAGFRTLDSIVRAKSIFGVTDVTIVTDGFHISRALFLADANGLNAVGFPSERVPFWVAKKTLAREVASRFVACLDVYLLKTKPRLLGKPEPIAVIRG